ncbi:MAG: SGNH/GDSL hydrolase family protein [Mariniphaga sp.]
MIQVPILNDIKDDNFLRINLFRLLCFVVLVILLDALLSILLLHGIERNYGLKSDSDILLVGHSHLMLALNKEDIERTTGKKIAKYTREGVNIADRLIMLKHYFAVCKKKPEMVVLSIDPWLFTGEGLSKNSYTLFYPFMDTPEVDKFIKTSVPRKIDYWSHKYFRSSRFDVPLLNSAIRGYMSNWSNFKLGIIDSIKLQHEIANGNYRKITFDQENISAFKQMLNYMEEQKVKVILLNTPVYKPLVMVQPDLYNKTINIITELAVKYRNTTVIDLSPEFTGHTSYFFDPIHMNPEGQKMVTKAFISRLSLIPVL